MSQDENPIDWGHYAQQVFGNGPGTGFLKAFLKGDGQIAEAFLDLLEEDGVISHDTPYVGQLL